MQRRSKNTRSGRGSKPLARSGGRTLKEKARTTGAKARTASGARAANVRKKSAKKAASHIKKHARKAMHDFYVISIIFLALVLLSSAFLLYQWKNYKIVQYGKEVQRLRADIHRLNGEIRPKQAFINKELKGPKRIMKVAGEKLGLKPSIQGPIIFTADKVMLEYYAEKDREEK